MARDLNLSVTLSAINRATGPLRQIMQGSQGAGRAIRETRDQLRNLQDQQKQLTAFRDMSRQSHATRRALMDKREELRQISQQLQSTEGPTRRLTQQQANAQREVDKLTREYRGQRDQVRELARQLPPGIEGTRGLAQQNEALARQIEETNRRLERQQNALRRLGDADVSGRFRNMTGEARRFTRNLTIGVTLAAGSIFGLANSTATLGDDVAKTADAIGMGITELQELRYAAERSGVATGTLDGSMQRFVRRIGLAAQGSGAAKKAYEELGLSAQELARMSPDRALGIVADRLNEIEDHTTRAAFASQLLGNSGADMLNMLKDGSDGLTDYARQARLTGSVLSEEAARGAEDFKDALLDAQLGMSGMRHTIGAELMPAVTQLMRELSGWMQENSHRVRAFAREFGERLKAAVPVIIELASGAARLAGTLADIVTRAADMVGGFDNLAMVVGGLFASKLILSVVMFGISLVKAGAALASLAATLPGLVGGIKALGLAFAATPIGWVIAGITAIAAGAIYLWRNWETIGPKFTALWDTLRELPGRAWAGIKAAFEDGIGGVTQLLVDWSPLGILWRGIRAGLAALGMELPGTLSELGGMIIDGLLGGLRAKAGEVRDAVTGIGGNIVGWFKERLGINSPSRVFAGFGGDLLDGLISGIDDKWSVLRDSIGNTAGAVVGWFKDRLGIRSPSRVFAQLGDDTLAGYRQGLERSEDGALREIKHFGDRVRRAGAGLALGTIATAAVASGNVESGGHGGGIAFDTRPPMAAPSAGGLQVSIGEINVHAAPGMDEQALARLVASEVQRALAEAERNARARQRSALFDTD
ncbi:hypothetical protein [Billgrantia ethanolica]|uniref:Phage tail tape measure protein n=1 Tax=Billgrantia ethanolica TaxID=2733486 RepID=A0ABS9A158_9GAMM|nr:hypothetical protein [Halomonas ethanolica]MCE8002546.1 hypothetical protein [Halomonas ethanolica]